MKKESKKGSYDDYIKGHLTNKEFHFLLTDQNGVPSVINSKGQPVRYVGSHRVEAFSIIREKNDKGEWKQRTIRYIPGESSIYKDEQSSDKDVPKKKYYIEFINGKKIVMGTDPLLTFMMKANYCATNPNKRADVQPIYYLVDVAKIIENDMVAERTESQAIHFAYEGEWSEVEAYARVLGINMDRSSEEIRHDMKIIAKRTKANPDGPEKFMKGLKSASMKQKANVLKAIAEGHLIVSSPTNSIAWSNNPNIPLYRAADGQNLIDSFVNKLATEEGTPTYDAILDLVAPEQKKESTMQAISQDEINQMKANSKQVDPLLSSMPVETDEELEKLLDDAVEAGFVDFTQPMWYNYKGQNHKKKEGFVKALKETPSMLKVLKAELFALKAQ